MKGKDKCKILKEIRREIAANNDINLVIEECTHQGECKGTCPRCEAEVRYLEKELEKRERLGKKLAVVGVSAALMAATTACSPTDVISEGIERISTVFHGGNGGGEIDGLVVMGEEEAPPTVDPETETEEIIELAGDVAYFPETEDGDPIDPPEETDCPEEPELEGMFMLKPDDVELEGLPMPIPDDCEDGGSCSDKSDSNQ